MKTCNDFQCQVLLRRTGELAQEEYADLDAHIQSCRECAAFARDFETTIAAASAVLLRREPSHAALERVHAQASAHLRASDKVKTNRALVLSLAAGLAFILAGLAAVQHGVFVRHQKSSRSTNSTQPAPSLSLLDANLKLAESLEAASAEGVFDPLFYDECFAVEHAEDLLREDLVSKLDLDIMYLEGMAI